MRKLFLYSGIIAFVFLWGCSPSSPTLATIGEEHYSLNDFDRDYKKNAAEGIEKTKPSREDAEKLLNLIIDYKLKIKEAKARNLQNDSSVQKERDEYRASVAQAYVIEKELVEPGSERYYERRKELLDIRHIFFPFPAQRHEGDTLEIYNHAAKVIEELGHVPFDSLVLKYSRDPDAKRNGGKLRYISAGRMIPSIEDACFSLHVGEYAKHPLQSQRGYHIIFLASKRPHNGTLELSHVLLKFSDNRAAEEKAFPDSAHMIYDKINKGMVFEDAVKQYSADKKNPQGRIGTFEEDDLFPYLVDSLEHVQKGGITNPIPCSYGYEIIKVLDRRPLPPYAVVESTIRNQYQQTRYSYDYKKVVDRVRKNFVVMPDSAVAAKFVHAFDTTKTPLSLHWADTLSAAFLEKPLFKSGVLKLTVQDAVKKIETNQYFIKELLTPHHLKDALDTLAEQFLFEQYALSDIPHYPALEALLNEYENGILLDRIEQEEVWKKIPVSDSLLQGYYELHKEHYLWSNRVNLAEIYVPNDSTARAVYKKIQQGKNFLELAEKNTIRPGYKEKKGIWGFHPVTENLLTDKASRLKIDSVPTPIQYEDGWSIIKTIARDSAQIKTFDEAKQEVLSEYQNDASERRKIEWIKELKSKYQVSINAEVLGEAVKKEESESR